MTKRYLPLILVLCVLALFVGAWWQGYLSADFLLARADQLRSLIDEYPLTSVAIFFVIYTLATASSFPAAAIITVFGGFLFGWLTAGITVAFAATLGATILFLAAKTALGASLRERVHKFTGHLAEGFERDAFSYLLVLRLAPIFPFFVINIAPAFFNVSLRQYVTATFFGILPGVFAYCYLGEGLESVVAAAREAGREFKVTDLVTTELTIAFFALAVVAAIPLVVKRVSSSVAQN